MRLARAGPFHFRRTKGPPRGRCGGSCISPNVQSLPPVAGWTQSGIDPMRVEAGLNRLLLPCPARLRPADDRQHPLHPTGQLGRTRLAALGRAGPVPGSGRRLAMRKSAAGTLVSGPASRSLCVVPKPPVAAPASQTGRSHFSLPGPRPRRRMPFASPAGAAATSLRTTTKGSSMQPSERAKESKGALDRQRASFETAAARPPQDEEESFMPFPNRPHPEERPKGASRRTHDVDAVEAPALRLARDGGRVFICTAVPTKGREIA